MKRTFKQTKSTYRLFD